MTSLAAFVPHPDDEGYSFGGTLALAVAAGWRVTVSVATDGERGERHDGIEAEPSTLGALRRGEFDVSCATLGAETGSVLGKPDGGLKPGDEEGVAWVLDEIARQQADVVLALGRDGGYGHPDHLAVYAWVEEARERLGGKAPAILYAAFRPGVFVAQHVLCVAAGVLGEPPVIEAEALGDLLADYEVGVRGVRKTKLAAMRAHRTQLPGGDPYRLFPEGTVEALLSVERFKDARGAPDLAVVRRLRELTPD